MLDSAARLLGQWAIWFQPDCEARCNIIPATLLHSTIRLEKYDQVLVALSPPAESRVPRDLPWGALLQFQQLWNFRSSVSTCTYLKKATVQPKISFSRMFPFTQGNKYPGPPPPPTGELVQIMFHNLKEPAAPQQPDFKVESYTPEQRTSLCRRMLWYFRK